MARSEVNTKSFIEFSFISTKDQDEFYNHLLLLFPAKKDAQKIERVGNLMFIPQTLLISYLEKLDVNPFIHDLITAHRSNLPLIHEQRIPVVGFLHQVIETWQVSLVPQWKNKTTEEQTKPVLCVLERNESGEMSITSPPSPRLGAFRENKRSVTLGAASDVQYFECNLHSMPSDSNHLLLIFSLPRNSEQGLETFKKGLTDLGVSVEIFHQSQKQCILKCDRRGIEHVFQEMNLHKERTLYLEWRGEISQHLSPVYKLLDAVKIRSVPRCYKETAKIKNKDESIICEPPMPSEPASLKPVKSLKNLLCTSWRAMGKHLNHTTDPKAISAAPPTRYTRSFR